MAQNAPADADSETYLNLQDELRKAMGEIARMQVELGEKDDLEKQLKLKVLWKKWEITHLDQQVRLMLINCYWT